MKKKYTILKEASVLLIAAALLFSAVTVTADTNEKNADDITNLRDVFQNGIAETPLIGANPLETKGVLFDQPPVPDDTTAHGAFSDAGQGPYRVYDNFWEVTGDILDIHWWGLFAYGTGAPYDGLEFEISFCADNGGIPDYENHIVDFAGTLGTEISYVGTGDLYWGYELFYMEMDLPEPVTMADGWVSVYKTTIAAEIFAWLDGLNGDSLGYQLGSASPILDYDMAFQLTGEAEAAISVEKQVYVPFSGDVVYQICLYDSYGDGWDTTYPPNNYVLVYVNGAEVGNYTLVTGSGPECFDIPVAIGDEITTDYVPRGSYPSENSYEILDSNGNQVIYCQGVYPDGPPDILPGEVIVVGGVGTWVDADTPEDAVEFAICDIIEFKITITNPTEEFPLFDISLEDYWDESLLLVDWDIEPIEIQDNYAMWFFPELMPGETIIIHVWMHVVGPHCSIDENLAVVTASSAGRAGRVTNSIDDSTVAANAENKQNLEPTLTDSSGHGQGEGAASLDVVWDNGMDYDGLGSSQYDTVYSLISWCADDFQFGEPTDVNDVHFVAGFWNGDPLECPWEVVFYEDDTGLPGTEIASYTFAWADMDIVDLGDGYFEFSADLPETLSFDTDKHWISVQGIQDFPPQTGFGRHLTIIGSAGAFKCEYFGYPEWVPVFDVFGYDCDFAFQLTYEEEPLIVTDEDSAFIHAMDPLHIDVEKYAGVVTLPPGDYELGLEDSYGDGWNGGFLDVYLNGVFYGTYTIESGAGPEYHIITVASGDTIFVDYTPGSWASENIWYLSDPDGNQLFYQVGSTDPDAHDETVETVEWFDADTPEEALDVFICDLVPFKITVTSDGMDMLEDVWVFDIFDDSLVFEYASIPPDYIGAGRLEWYYLGSLLPGESFTIIVWFHVVGPDSSIDENIGYAEDCYIIATDEDSAFVHCVEPDTVPPETTIEIDGTAGDNGWLVSDATITITATDDDSGVLATYYSLDGGDFIEYTDPITVSDDGEHTIAAYSVDNQGNVEDPPVEDAFMIDQTVPTIELTWDENNSLLIADVADDTSGVAKVEFYVNGDLVGTVTEAPFEFEYTEAAKGDKGQAIVYDNAGNTAESEEIDPYMSPQGQSTPTVVVKQIQPQNI